MTGKQIHPASDSNRYILKFNRTDGEPECNTDALIAPANRKGFTATLHNNLDVNLSPLHVLLL